MSEKFCDWIIDKFLPAIAIIILIISIGGFGVLCSILIGETKQNSKAKAVFYYCDESYYIDSYTIRDNEIIAINVRGEEMIFPKDRTVIKNKGE